MNYFLIKSSLRLSQTPSRKAGEKVAIDSAVIEEGFAAIYTESSM